MFDYVYIFFCWGGAKFDLNMFGSCMVKCQAVLAMERELHCIVNNCCTSAACHDTWLEDVRSGNVAPDARQHLPMADLYCWFDSFMW